MSIELVIPSNHLILSHPLLLPPSIFPSIRVLSNESVLHIRWPKYWSFSFSISSSSEYSGLISFRMDWLDLVAVQGTLKSLLQHRSSKASILRPTALLHLSLSVLVPREKTQGSDLGKVRERRRFREIWLVGISQYVATGPGPQLYHSSNWG